MSLYIILFLFQLFSTLSHFSIDSKETVGHIVNSLPRNLT